MPLIRKAAGKKFVLGQALSISTLNCFQKALPKNTTVKSKLLNGEYITSGQADAVGPRNHVENRQGWSRVGRKFELKMGAWAGFNIYGGSQKFRGLSGALRGETPQHGETKRSARAFT